MRQKVTNGDIKKRFILYKGHTGWKIKTRIFGSLLISFSAFAIAESTGIVDVHAATTSTQTVMSNGASESPTPVGSNANNTSESTSQMTQATQPQQSTTDNSSTTTTKYPVLSQNQEVSVGADTTSVDLTADQIGDHFTATVENRDGGDKDNDVADNTYTQTINADGSVSLTTLDSHDVYSSPNNTTNVIGHQAAHVSFEHEIDFSHNFSMSGSLGIGSKSNGGADSVGFIFAPGDPSEATKGGSGGELGLGGLSNAFGFIFDEYSNSNFNDPSNITYPYVGWRKTDSSGNLQKNSSGEVQSAGALGLKRSSEPVNDFTMNYDASTKMLTVALNGTTFSRKIDDIDTGYSLSVSASTGGSWNDYSAKISRFSYTPKTIPLKVHLVDSADQNALLDNIDVNAVANIGDTISVFSTQEAAARAVAAGEVDASLVSVIPKDSAGNVYLIDGDQVIENNNGTVHVIKGEDGIADSTYYSYTVTDGANQQMTVPVRLAFTAKVTPVDSVTQEPISGLQPVTVIAVAGKSSLVQIPGYTPTKVILNAPADGQKTADDVLPIDQGTTKSDTSIPTTDTANPIGHYYTGNGKTIDGQSVVDNATVGTGQSISDNLNKQPYQDDKGKAISSGGKEINSDDYYWSDVGNASATDSLDSNNPQVVNSILLPTTATLDYWEQQATDNQNTADSYREQAQNMYDDFVGLSGLTDDQKASADKLLQSVVDIYAQVSDKNGQAKTAFENAKTATAATDIYNDGQTGYENLEAVKNLLVSFNDDLNSLKTTNTKAQNSLATFDSWIVTYGDDNGFPKVSFGPDFGTVNAEQIDGLDNPSYYEFYTFGSSGIGDKPVIPKDVGKYIFKLTDAGRAYLKSLSNSADAGLYVSGTLEIVKKDVEANVNDSTVVYGDTPEFSGKLDVTDVGSENFEIFDNNTNEIVTADQLQAGGDYSIRYTEQAQADLNKGNYNITKFNTGKLTVNKRPLTVTAPQSVGKTYGDTSEPELIGTPDGLVNGDTLESIDFHLVRDPGEAAGTYNINESTSDNIKNYSVKVNPGKFIIGQKPVTVDADNISIEYGKTDPELTFTVDPSSLVGNDKKSDLDVTLTREPGKDVGNYQITGSSYSENYQVNITPGTFTITPANNDITIEPTKVTYGNAPEFTSYLSINGTTNNLEKSDYEIIDSKGNVVTTNLQAGGNYRVQLKAGALEKLHDANPNYVFSNPAGTAKLVVVKRDITVTAADGHKTYGDDDPTKYVLTDDSAIGLVNGDKLSDLGVVLSRAEGENAGEYKISLDDSSELNKNYTINVNDGEFTINKKQITVKAADSQKIYGDGDPTFTLSDDSANQLVNNDKITDLTVNLTRAEGENAGDYTISGTAENNNYDIKVTSGTFTINKASANVTIADANIVYEDTPEFSAKASVGQTTFDQSDFEIIDANKNIVKASDLQAGDYAIKLTDKAIEKLNNENPNYKFDSDSITSANLNVAKRKIIVTIDDQPVYVGENDPQNNAVLVKPRIGDDDLLPSLNLSYNEPDSITVGTYDITASSDNPNFDVTIIPGKLIVLGKDVDKDGNVTVTEKDKNGNVVEITKQWHDDGNKETVYNYDPETGTKTVTETDDGKTVDQQTIDPTKGQAILPDDDGAATVVTIDDSNEPNIIHYQSDPDKDELTSADELIKYGTDPLNPDSDKDGISDGDEVKNGTDPLVANISNRDEAKVVLKNQTVGTTTKMVKLYNKDGELITDRMLGVNTDWQSDEEYTLDGILYYRVSTNEFVKASDVYVYLYQGQTFVRVYNDEKGNLIDYSGSPVSRSLAPSSEWRTDRIAIINGKNYYRVSTNEFVPVDKVYEYVDSKTVITTNSQTTVYNERGKKTGVTLPANTAYKVDKTVSIDNVINYRVSTNEFIKND